MSRGRATSSASFRTLLWSVAVRMALMLLAFQSTGMTHALSDVVESFTTGHLHADADCPDDGPDTDCPPGCPTCHCGHAASASLLPAALQTSVIPLPLAVQPVQMARDDRQGSAPYLPCVFRPPRLS